MFPFVASMAPRASPGGTTGPQLTPRKCVIRVSISCIVRSLRGGATKGWSAMNGPSGILFTHCSMIRRLCRISSTWTTAVVAITMRSGRNIKLEILIAGVRLLFSEVPFESRRPEHGSRHAPFNGLFDGHNADALGSRLENAVFHYCLVIFGKARRHILQEITEHAFPAVWQVLGGSPDAEPDGMHASAAHSFYDVKGALTVIEAIEYRRHLADVLRECSVPHEVADNPEQFRHHHADHLPAWRDLDACELLESHKIGEFVHHPAQVVNAVGVGYEFVPGLAFAHLLRAAVMEANLRDTIDNLFSIKLDNNTENTVCAGVLRADVQKDKVRTVLATLHAPVFGPEPQGFLLSFFLFVRLTERPDLRAARRMVFAQGMPHPGFRHQDSRQERMAVELDAEHVPHFPLIPVR